MALEFVGSATGQTTSSSNYTVTLPTLEENDLVIIISGESTIGSRNKAPTTGDYTQLASLAVTADARDINLYVGYKVMGATPDTTVTLPGVLTAGQQACAAIAYVWRGQDLSTPIDATTTTASGIDSAIFDSPSITPVTTGAVVLTIGASTSDSTEDVAITEPSGYSSNLVIHGEAGTNRGLQIGVGSKAWTSGAENPAAWSDIDTTTFDSWAAVTVALRPASSGGSTGQIKVWNGSAWVAKPVKVWNGSSWVVKPVKYWNGSSWVETTY